LVLLAVVKSIEDNGDEEIQEYLTDKELERKEKDERGPIAPASYPFAPVAYYVLISGIVDALVDY
jgi:hypothetical protein